MFNNNFVIMLIGIVLAVYTLYNSAIVRSIEGYAGGMPSRIAKLDTPPKLSQDMFCSSGPGFQSQLSPRFGNIALLGNLRDRMAPENFMAFNKANPISYANMVKEGYCKGGSCDTQLSNKRNAIRALSSTAGNRDMVVGNVEATSTYPDASSLIPVGDMTTPDSLGQETQSINFDRMIYANRQNNRLRSQGDKLRGDLAIVPNRGQWFNVSVNPQIDSEPGAMNVMAGFDNSSSKNQAALSAIYSGGGTQISGGIDVAPVMNQFSQRLGSALADVTVAAF